MQIWNIRRRAETERNFHTILAKMIYRDAHAAHVGNIHRLVIITFFNATFARRRKLQHHKFLLLLSAKLYSRGFLSNIKYL